MADRSNDGQPHSLSIEIDRSNAIVKVEPEVSNFLSNWITSPYASDPSWDRFTARSGNGRCGAVEVVGITEETGSRNVLVCAGAPRVFSPDEDPEGASKLLGRRSDLYMSFEICRRQSLGTFERRGATS